MSAMVAAERVADPTVAPWMSATRRAGPSIERKNAEKHRRADGRHAAQLQEFLSDSPWDDEGCIGELQRFVGEWLGTPCGVLVLDDTGFPKKGVHSAGVGRQYSGTLRRVDNCQVGMFLGYASAYGHTLVDRRLYLTESWLGDPAKRHSPRAAVGRTPAGRRGHTSCRPGAGRLGLWRGRMGCPERGPAACGVRTLCRERSPSMCVACASHRVGPSSRVSAARTSSRGGTSRSASDGSREPGRHAAPNRRDTQVLTGARLVTAPQRTALTARWAP